METNIKPYVYKARITNVVDGDTIDAIVDVGFKMTTTQRLRFLGVDAAELRDKSDEQRNKALLAKAYVISHLLNKDALIETKKSDVFGRYLATVYLGEVNFNLQLIKEGYALEYDKD
jgi:micrococcal nuclease